MLSVRKLSFVFLLLLLVPFLLGLVEVTEVTLPVVESLRVLVDDVGRDCVKERSVVRSDCELLPYFSGSRTYTTKIVPGQVCK
jgi:hypothetical protein